MRQTVTVVLAATLVVATGAWAQAQPQAQSPQQPAVGGEPGFFRPSNDIRLAPPAPRPAQAATQAPLATAPAVTMEEAEVLRRAEALRLERMEASMDRIETRNQRAMEEANRQLPPIASPADGTARTMSPLDGTAPLISGLR